MIDCWLAHSCARPVQAATAAPRTCSQWAHHALEIAFRIPSPDLLAPASFPLPLHQSLNLRQDGMNVLSRHSLLSHWLFHSCHTDYHLHRSQIWSTLVHLDLALLCGLNLPPTSSSCLVWFGDSLRIFLLSSPHLLLPPSHISCGWWYSSRWAFEPFLFGFYMLSLSPLLWL